MPDHAMSPAKGLMTTRAQSQQMRQLYRVWREQIAKLERRRICLSARQKRLILRDLCQHYRTLERSCRLLQA
ncbi:hypothetical protein [Asaia bogorensis]|uniref:hypothetical protein n=1 Tax=Asaia bogorensis TaxID=91915 RepID=UPI000EFCADB9|nr:hypothetical protein [Asaia bogorensis]